MAAEQSLAKEIYEENIRLRSMLAKEKKLDDSPTDITEDGNTMTLKLLREVLRNKFEDGDIKSTREMCVRRNFTKLLLGTLLFVAILAVFLLLFMYASGKSSPVSEPSVSAAKQIGNAIGNLPEATKPHSGVDQGCDARITKKSFPDFDYSLMGYNILRGFPLATGHDPGFTFPIFTADYSTKIYSADCEYSIPEGFVVVPDVSCMTSFTSTTVQSSYEYSKELSVSANVEGGGWGVSFSASAGYKESSSIVASGESVLILSSAQCNYYFSKLIQDEPPKFNSVFIEWVRKLNASLSSNNTQNVFIQFLELYGTHFPTMMTYGARFTHQHKMKSSDFKAQTSKGFNVGVQAGFAGMISVGASSILSSEDRESALMFAKSVETTTFTVGAAPPANGDAMTWASEVKERPLPTKYDLTLISHLFTDRYMGDLEVDHKTIQKHLDELLPEYCKYMKQKGQVDTCRTVDGVLSYTNARLMNHYDVVLATSESICNDKCMEEQDCSAVTMCLTCNSWAKDMCYMYRETTPNVTAKQEGVKNAEDVWKSLIFLSKIKKKFQLKSTEIEGKVRSTELKNISLTECNDLCVEDKYCTAYSYCTCPSKVQNCFLYSEKAILGLKQNTQDEFVTYFIGNELKKMTAPSVTVNRTQTMTTPNATT